MSHLPLHLIEWAAHSGAFGQNLMPEPSEAQCLAGNYKLGRVHLHGLALAIEHPRGSTRSGVDAKTGKRWASRMAAHYGYINGTKGNDGDCVDCFIGFDPQSERAYIINQSIAGKFDEHKVMLAFPDLASARRAYLNSYERGWDGLESIVPASIAQLKWWLRNADMRHPLRAHTLPNEGLETMARKTYWNSAALPEGTTLDQVLYDIRRSDAGAGLLLDSVSIADIIEDAEGVLTFDALVVPYARLERKMELLRGVMERTGSKVKPVALQITDPFRQRGVAQVAVIFELSDGQTVSIFLHNPDVTPNKMAPTDEVISWKWLLNKKDITIVVAPERGADLNVREVARRIMRLAEKNSPAFQRVNGKRAERMQNIQSLKDEIVTLETELATVQHELEVAKIAAEDKPFSGLLTQEQQDELEKREEKARAILEAMTDEQIAQVGASPSLAKVVTTSLGRFKAIDKILDNHPDDIESAIACVAQSLKAGDTVAEGSITQKDGAVPPATPDVPPQHGEGEPPFMLMEKGNSVVYSGDGKTRLPGSWVGVAADASSAKSFWWLGRDGGERSFNKLFATTYQDALKEADALAARIDREAAEVQRLRDAANRATPVPSPGEAVTQAPAMAKEPAGLAVPAGQEPETKPEPTPAPTPETKPTEQDLIAAYVRSFGEATALVNTALAAVDLAAIKDSASAAVEIKKLADAAHRGQYDIIGKASRALESIGIETWDERITKLREETPDFAAWGAAQDAASAAHDKIRALAKERLIEAGKAELAALPPNAPLADIGRAIFRKAGIDSKEPPAIVAAIEAKDVDRARSILSTLENKSSAEIFERATGIRLGKTQRERQLQIDAWAGITPEQRARLDAQRTQELAAKERESSLEWAWNALSSMNVRASDGVVRNGKDFLKWLYARGFTEVITRKVGASTEYRVRNADAGDAGVKDKKFTTFLKSAQAFGGVHQALEHLGAVVPETVLTDAQKIAAVDAAYSFAEATDAFKLWLHESVGKAGHSPFLTAMRIDEAVKRHGASVQWGQFAALDNAGQDGPQDDETGAVLDMDVTLDSADTAWATLGGYVGKVRQGDQVLGRIDIDEDGQAMVYVGAAGDIRVKTAAGQNFVYSGEGVSEMVDALFAAPSAPAAPTEGVAIELTGKELGDFPDTPEGLKELRKAAKAALSSLRGEWVDVPSLRDDEGNARQVEIRRRGIKELLAFSANPDKLKMVAMIREIISTAKNPQWEANIRPAEKPDAVGYFRMSNLVSIAGRTIDVAVLIEQDSQGLLHYDFLLPEKAKAALDSAAFGVSAISPHHNYGTADAEDVSSLDATGQGSKTRMVINLFIEGEEPQVVEVDSDAAPRRHRKVRRFDAFIAIAADSLAALRKIDVYRVLSDAPQDECSALGEYIASGRPDLAQEVSEVLAELAPAAASPKDADRSLLQSVIDGTVADILAPELADQLEAALLRNQGDPELVQLFEQAVTAYQNAMLAATTDIA